MKKYDRQYYRERMAELRRERKEQGLKLVQVWVPERYEDELKDYAYSLMERVGISTVLSLQPAPRPPAAEPPRATPNPTDLVSMSVEFRQRAGDEIEIDLAATGFMVHDKGLRWTHQRIQRKHAEMAEDRILAIDPSAQIRIG